VTSSRQFLRPFYGVRQGRDLDEGRRYLADDLVFVGLFKTHPNADAYMAALTGLLSIAVRLEV